MSVKKNASGYATYPVIIVIGILIGLGVAAFIASLVNQSPSGMSDPDGLTLALCLAIMIVSIIIAHKTGRKVSQAIRKT